MPERLKFHIRICTRCNEQFKTRGKRPRICPKCYKTHKSIKVNEKDAENQRKQLRGITQPRLINLICPNCKKHIGVLEGSTVKCLKCHIEMIKIMGL